MLCHICFRQLRLCLGKLLFNYCQVLRPHRCYFFCQGYLLDGILAVVSELLNLISRNCCLGLGGAQLHGQRHWCTGRLLLRYFWSLLELRKYCFGLCKDFDIYPFRLLKVAKSTFDVLSILHRNNHLPVSVLCFSWCGPGRLRSSSIDVLPLTT